MRKLKSCARFLNLRVNKIKAMYERLCVNVKFVRGTNSTYAGPNPYIATRVKYLRTHVKIALRGNPP